MKYVLDDFQKRKIKIVKIIFIILAVIAVLVIAFIKFGIWYAKNN